MLPIFLSKNIQIFKKFFKEFKINDYYTRINGEILRGAANSTGILIVLIIEIYLI